MKIGIFGSYNAPSIGDHAILEGILSGFHERLHSPSFVIFSFAPNATKTLLMQDVNLRTLNAAPIMGPTSPTSPPRHRPTPSHSPPQRAPFISALARNLRATRRDLKIVHSFSHWRNIQQEIAELDVLLIGGGNLIMDMFGGWPIYPLIYAFLARRVGTPMMFFAVGAGPLQSRRGRWYFSLAARWAQALTFRDSPSLEYAAHALRCPQEKLHLSADPATLLSHPNPNASPTTSGAPRIGITLTPYFSPAYWPNADESAYRHYLQNMAEIITEVQRQFDAHILFFATNHPNDLLPAQEVRALLSPHGRDNIEIIENRMTIPEMLALLDSLDLFIGTRLHSLLLAWIANVPSLALAYQPKVAHFYRRVHMDAYLFELAPKTSVPPTQIVMRLREMHEQHDAFQRRMQIEMAQLRQEAMRSIDMAVEIAANRAR